MGRIKRICFKRQNTNPILSLFILLPGVFGIVLFLRSIDGISFAEEIVFLFLVLFCASLWFFWSVCDRKNVFWIGLLISAVLCMLLAALDHTALETQILHILRCLQGESGAEIMDITGCALVIAYLVSLLLFLMEFVLNWHPLPCLLTMALVFLSPFVRVRISSWVFLLLLLFQGTFLIVFLFRKRKENRKLKAVNHIRILWKSTALAAAFLILIFLVVSPLAFSYSDSLYQAVYDAEGFVYRSAMNLSGQAQDPVTGGVVSRGNNYQTGTTHLELTASGEPTQTLYLRGFGGGEYTGGDWIRSSDEALFEQMQDSLGWGEETISSMYYSMYFVLNENMQEDGSEPISLHISHSSGNYENAYVPYYSQRNRSWNLSGWDRQTGGTGNNTGYDYDYYEQTDMHIDWENVLPDFTEQAEAYHDLQDAYIEQIQTAYTQVPTDLLPRLSQLVEDNPLNELNDITAFILYTLHSNATYSLTPGWAPLNEDIVEYFLFEGQIGYCVHFAAAATLLYRLYGIPARYAAGYMVEPESFLLQEDGSYHAEVTDESAHAWVEIFLPEYGWTPVEVTPASDGSAVTSYPGFDGTEWVQILQEHNWNAEIPFLNETELSEEAQTEESIENLSVQELLQEIDLAQYRDIFLVLGSCLLYTVLLLPMFFDYRRLRKYRTMKRMNPRKIFDRFLEMLHWCGLLREMDGTENDFQQRLTETVPECDMEKTAFFLKIIRGEAYGPDTPSDAETNAAFQYYCDMSELLYNRQTFWKKLKFKYFKAF